MFLFRAECQDSILAQFSELPAGASRLHFGSFRQNGTRCMPESLGEPGLRQRTPPTRSLFASFAGCRQDHSGQAWGTRASGLNVGLVGCQDQLDLEEAADLEKATSQLGLAQVVAEADRLLEDNGTAKETKAVLRRWSSTWVGVARAVKVLSSGKAQKIYPGKWTLSGLKDELQQKLREFVEEAGLFASFAKR